MFCDKSGNEITKDEFVQTKPEIVGGENIDVNGDGIHVFSRFSGIDHDGTGKGWETGVTSSNPKNAAHEKYHGYHVAFGTKAECETEHSRVVAAIKAGKAL